MANTRVPDRTGSAPLALALLGLFVFGTVVLVLFALSPLGTVAAMALGAVVVWDATSNTAFRHRQTPLVTVRRVSIGLALAGVVALMIWA